MEELKLLIDMVANLPMLAVWVLIGYLVYKVVVIGSIYGLARFAIEKAHSWAVRDKTKEIGLVFEGHTWGSGQTAFLNQLRRISGNPEHGLGYYITQSHAQWLSEAIDDKLAKDEKPK